MIQTVTASSFQMDYLSFGKGKRAFVILPGISVKPVFSAETALTAAFDAFTKDYTVYVFERRRDLPADADVSLMAEDTAEAMKALGLDNADLFGASQGGMMALLLAARHPDLARRAVLCSTYLCANEASDVHFDRWTALARNGRAGELDRDMTEHLYSPAFQKRYADLLLSKEGEGTAEELRRFAVLSNACTTFSAAEEVRNIRCPTLTVAARGDRVIPYTCSAALARELHGELFLYDGYSHAVYDEAPNFRPRMLAFFKTDAKSLL